MHPENRLTSAALPNLWITAHNHSLTKNSMLGNAQVGKTSWTKAKQSKGSTVCGNNISLVYASIFLIWESHSIPAIVQLTNTSPRNVTPTITWHEPHILDMVKVRALLYNLAPLMKKNVSESPSCFPTIHTHADISAFHPGMWRPRQRLSPSSLVVELEFSVFKRHLNWCPWIFGNGLRKSCQFPPSWNGMRNSNLFSNGVASCTPNEMWPQLNGISSVTYIFNPTALICFITSIDSPKVPVNWQAQNNMDTLVLCQIVCRLEWLR